MKSSRTLYADLTTLKYPNLRHIHVGLISLDRTGWRLILHVVEEGLETQALVREGLKVKLRWVWAQEHFRLIGPD